MKIRLYQPKYAKEVQRLLEEFLEYTRTNSSKNVLSFENFITSRKAAYTKQILTYFFKLKRKRFLVAIVDGKVVGYIIGYTQRNPYEIRSKAGYIQSYFVSKKYRGKGVGKELNITLVNWFKKQKCDHLTLEVYDGNTKTKAMYKRLGFVDILTKMKKKL